MNNNKFNKQIESKEQLFNNCLGQIATAEDNAVQTLQQLNIQKEQLENSINNTTEIQESLKSSESIIKSMSSFIFRLFNKEKTKETSIPSHNISQSNNEILDNIISSHNISYKDTMNDDIDKISKSLQNLHYLGLEINKELHQHNDLLDNYTQQTNDTIHKINYLHDKIKKL